MKSLQSEPSAAAPIGAALLAFLLLIMALTFSLSGTALASGHNTKEIRALQQVLHQCGFDPGPSDGRWGTKTARATADYIRAHGGHPRSGGEIMLILQAQDYIISAGSPCPKVAQRQDTQPRTSQAQDSRIREIQQALIQCGFDPGPTDGVWGRKTARAMAVYIRAHGGTARDPDRHRTDLIAQADSYRKGPQPCPPPGTEVWDCSTLFETSTITLTADHDTGTGRIGMGSLPTIETFFAVEGLDRMWIWDDSVGDQYQFLIGPRASLGLRGYYFHFPASTEEDEMVKSRAAYSCEQASG